MSELSGKKQQQTDPFYAKSAEEVLAALESQADGLSDQEAAKRLEQYGSNELEAGKKTTMLQKFLEQFKD